MKLYDPDFFYEVSTEKLMPGDILFLSNFDVYEDTYWIVLSSLCDLDNRDHIILSKIIHLDSIHSVNSNNLGNIRKYKYYYYFYLPELENEFTESVAHYGKIKSFSRQLLTQGRMSESDIRTIKSLSPKVRRLFQYHLANHFTRDETQKLFQSEIDGWVEQLKKI